MLSDFNTATPAFFWFPLAWNLFIHPVTLRLCELKWNSCVKHICACSVMFVSLWRHGFWSGGFLCPWDYPSKNTEVGCHILLRGVFLIQGSNLCLLHWQAYSVSLKPPGKPREAYSWVLKKSIHPVSAFSLVNSAYFCLKLLLTCKDLLTPLVVSWLFCISILPSVFLHSFGFFFSPQSFISLKSFIICAELYVRNWTLEIS